MILWYVYSLYHINYYIVVKTPVFFRLWTYYIEFYTRLNRSSSFTTVLVSVKVRLE